MWNISSVSERNMIIVIFNLAFVILIYEVCAAPQEGPEINDQFEQLNNTALNITEDVRDTEIDKVSEAQRRSDTNPEFHTEKHTEIERKIVNSDLITDNSDATDLKELTLEDVNSDANIPSPTPKPTFLIKIYQVVLRPFEKFAATPRVVKVVRNIGTCIVNGAMDLVSFYFPAPLIPLLATAASMMIPFEPVVMLKEKMPVTSYRRAFQTAVNGFLSTFNRYREDEDPYMTRSFNRRFLGDSKEKDKVKITDTD